MTIYSPAITSRLQYIFEFVGKQIIGRYFTITSDVHSFKQSAALKINYSEERISNNEIWIKPHTLLFEKDIKQQETECFDFNGHKAFFKTEGDFPFDIFAATFYLISRYEEYLPHQKDKYGRYAHQGSLAYKEGFLQLPLVNIWLEEFKNLLAQKESSFTIHHSPFTFLPTYDIDEGFSYKHKGLLRTAGGMAKAILKGNVSRVFERIAVLRGKKDDPFDAHLWMLELNQKYKLSPRYFFLVPRKLSRYDRNISPDEFQMQMLMISLCLLYHIGVHPSWQSGDNLFLIEKEIMTIEKITHCDVVASRQHFIRFTLPQTYRCLDDLGIREEFSMGYGSINGFRASVASPFYWYDLEKEEQTGLMIYPFCYMEANSFFEQKLTPEQAFDEMMHYYNVVKEVNGTMITIWHNTFLGTDKLFKGWREVYEKFIEAVSSQKPS